MFERFKCDHQRRPAGVCQGLREALDKLATGEVFTADQALENGLVDKIGFVEEAIDRAMELAKLDKTKTRVVRYQRPADLMSVFGAAQARSNPPPSACRSSSTWPPPAAGTWPPACRPSPPAGGRISGSGASSQGPVAKRSSLITLGSWCLVPGPSCLAPVPYAWRLPTDLSARASRDAPERVEAGGVQHFAADLRAVAGRQPPSLGLGPLPHLHHPLQHGRAEIGNLAQIDDDVLDVGGVELILDGPHSAAMSASVKLANVNSGATTSASPARSIRTNLPDSCGYLCLSELMMAASPGGAAAPAPRLTIVTWLPVLVERHLVHEGSHQQQPAAADLFQVRRIGRVGQLVRVEARPLVADDERAAVVGDTAPSRAAAGWHRARGRARSSSAPDRRSRPLRAARWSAPGCRGTWRCGGPLPGRCRRGSRSTSSHTPHCVTRLCT